MNPSSTRRFELFVAGRYLRAKRKQAVISVITVISIVGVAAGVMALVIALAINNGFRNTLQRSLLGATAHVQILEKEPKYGIENWQELDPKLRKIPHVISVKPDLYGYVLVAGPIQPAGAVLKGIPVDNPPEMLRNLKAGSFDRLKDTEGLPGVILGTRLADSTGMRLNSVVKIISPQGELTPFGPEPAFFRFRVVGLFETGFYDIDNGWAFTSLKSSQTVFGLENVVNSIELRLDDIYRAPEVAKAAEKIIGPKLGATTWMAQYHQILAALNSEKIVTAVTVGLIELVAALNILITLVMLVMEKNRDIAILMSMGAETAADPPDFHVPGRVDRSGGDGAWIDPWLYSVVPGEQLPLAEPGPGRLRAELCAVRAALGGRDLDRGRSHFRELHRDAVPGPRGNHDRSGRIAALRVIKPAR